LSGSLRPAQRVFVAALAELEPSEALCVPLAADALGRPREAVIVCDDEGLPRAYLNLCKHLPIPLDGGSRRFLIDGQLQCVTHGARYRRSDGLCVAGPCRGASLRALATEVEAGLLFVIDDPRACI
jgi:nitrite reductase/ring-hydroxylating ferredoxin subunit